MSRQTKHYSGPSGRGPFWRALGLQKTEMSDPSNVSMCFQKWDSFHLQIVSIALVYACDKLQSTDTDYRHYFLQPLPSALSSSVVGRDDLQPNPDLPNTVFKEKLKRSCDKLEKQINKTDQDPAPDHRTLPTSSLKDTREEGELEKIYEQEWIQMRKTLSESWLQFILDSFKLERDSLPQKPSLRDLNKLSTDVPASIHLEIIHDLVLLSLSSPHLSQQAKSTQSRKKSVQEVRYSALDRHLIFLVAESLGIDSTVVYGAEKLVAQELFFLMQQKSETIGNNSSNKSSKEDSDLANSSQSALHAAAVKKEWLRYLGAGAGVIVGGVAIGLTGGLAAPILAPFLVGISGGALGFLATSGGAILIGTLFGLAGGGLTGYRAQRRLKGISEFTFERLPHREDDVDGDIPRIPSLHASATVVISGFLLTPTDYKDPWFPTFNMSIDHRDVYAIKVETKDLLSAGKGLETYVRDTLIPYGAVELLSHTAIASVCAAFLLPASVYKTAVMALDNEYQRTRDIFEKAGILLADMIEQEAHGARPLTLIGSGMGTITIFRAILELSKRMEGNENESKKLTIIDQVILICSPISPSLQEWNTVRRMVTRRLINVYSKNDWVLTILARLDSFFSCKMSTQVAGLMDLGLPHATSVDISDLVHGHLELNSKMPEILDRINIDR